MDGKLNSSVQSKEDITFVRLAGIIDEDNTLGDLSSKIGSGTCAIDVAEVERINSCGVRDWVNWLGEIEGKGVRPVFINCSPAIVAQINLVNNFTGGGAVKSFYAPYFCPDHGEKLLLIEGSEMGPPPHNAPTCRCDECDSIMDFDDMEDSYFAFLANPGKISDVAGIEKKVESFIPEDEKSKVRSRVSSTGLSALSSSPGKSLPSVPSLPSISRSASSIPGYMPKTQSQINLGTQSGAGSPATGSESMAPKGNTAVYVLVGLLVAAIGVLAFLLLK